jgi:DNA-binding transcriptional MerR regulator
MRAPPDPEPERLTISELAERSRTSIASIKFYMREGILPSGDLSAKHRAFYGEAHVRRLRVIHALRNVGGLSLLTIGGICRLIDADHGTPVIDVVSRTMDALGLRGPRKAASGRKEHATARSEVLGFLDARGIRVRRHATAVEDLAAALITLRNVIGPEVGAHDFAPYLDAMCALAERDYQANKDLFANPQTVAEAATLAVVLGIVLWEPVLLLMRRIALEHVAARKLRPRFRIRRRARSR